MCASRAWRHCSPKVGTRFPSEAHMGHNRRSLSGYMYSIRKTFLWPCGGSLATLVGLTSTCSMCDFQADVVRLLGREPGTEGRRQRARGPNAWFYVMVSAGYHHEAKDTRNNRRMAQMPDFMLRCWWLPPWGGKFELQASQAGSFSQNLVRIVYNQHLGPAQSETPQLRTTSNGASNASDVWMMTNFTLSAATKWW